MRTNKKIASVILKGLLLTGGLAVASASPYFLTRILPKILRLAKYKLKKRRDRKKFQRSFYYLKKNGMIKIEKKGRQIYISLTKKGKKKANKYKIDDLQIKKPKKWDGRWRILIFDIEDKHKIKREALRGKLKELGLYMIQKSVWVCPYQFQREIDILRDFFDLKHMEMRIITADEIEKDNDVKLFFGLS